MKAKVLNRTLNELDKLCITVRALVEEGRLESCMKPICEAMEQNPHAPQPHNLLGIVLEKMGDHPTAMKHFRAAWALDPTYAPVSHNLNTYGTFFSSGRCAFDESDLSPNTAAKMKIVFDERGIGRVVSKTKIEYGQNGVGYAVGR